MERNAGLSGTKEAAQSRASSDERKVKRMINVLDINEDGKEIVTELKIERNMGWDVADLLVLSVCLPPRISCKPIRSPFSSLTPPGQGLAAT